MKLTTGIIQNHNKEGGFHTNGDDLLQNATAVYGAVIVCGGWFEAGSRCEFIRFCRFFILLHFLIGFQVERFWCKGSVMPDADEIAK